MDDNYFGVTHSMNVRPTNCIWWYMGMVVFTKPLYLKLMFSVIVPRILQYFYSAVLYAKKNL